MTGKAVAAQAVAGGGVVAGIGSIFAGLACAMNHFAAGDLFTLTCQAAQPDGTPAGCTPALLMCLGLIAAGVGVFSPGVQALKVGMMARPAEPATPAKS